MQLSKSELALLSRLLDEGLGLPNDAREQWVDSLTEPFAGAKSVLRGILAKEASGEMANFLDTLPKFEGGIGNDKSQRPALEPGTRIGNYRVVRQIGEGGMGAVWLALRTDVLTDRPVALKLPYMHLQSARFAERYARERDILAKLAHPNIAHLYDAGISAEGQPYLAMEFVAGDPLTDYCDGHGLGIDERLQLFIQVLAAVQYAHNHNIIHRDLKPSNILVRETVQVSLLDFGIAKLLIEGEADETELTRHGGASLTPHYASPEQIKGETLGVSSDVYSLGVVLYQLLAGRRPYELQSSTRRALEEAVLSTDPRPPSDMMGRNKIPGELDNIVLKALKKRPRDRYATAKDLADDLGHFLANEPISARADSVWYRARKFAARHKASLQSAALAGALVALVLLCAGWLWRASSRNDLAGVAANPVNSGAKVEGQASPFAPPVHSVAVLPFVNLSGDSKQDYFSDGISEEMLNSLSRLDQLQVAARTSSFSFKGKSTDILEIARKLDVGAILEGSVRRAGHTVRISVQLINGENGFHIWSQTYDRELTDILAVQTDVATSVAQQLRVKLVGDEAGKIEVGGTLNAQAYDAFLRGMQTLANWDFAEAPLKAALADFENAISIDPGYAAAFAQRARVLDYLAIFVAKPQDRAGLQHEALASAQRAVALAPESGAAHLELAQVLAYAMFDFSAALPEYEKGLSLEPGSARVQDAIAGFYSQLGRSERAISIARRVVGLDPQNAQSHITLGIVLEEAKHYEEALLAVQHALLLNPKSHYPGVWRYDILLALGQNESAREQCESRSAPLDEDSRHECLALAYHALSQQTRAERELARMKALDGDGRALGYASIYAQWGQISSALKWLAIADKSRDSELQNLKVWWRLDPIRQTPEFKAVEARMNFPQ
jgi:eukaryotic-like serine/threonine-protein kinase